MKVMGMELNNLLINNNPEALIKLNMQYSSSVLARRNLHQLYNGDLNIPILEMPKGATNRNAEINNNYLKPLGIMLNTGE